MRRFFIFFQMVFAFFFISSCKKDYPVASNGTPVFYFNGTVGGSPVNLQAGINSYYMYSSYIQDSSNIYHFLGDLKQTNCTNCTNRIQFQINDYKISALSSSAVIDSSLMIGYYPIQVLSGTSTQYSVNFTALPYDSSATASSYSWNFGDGATSISANPTHIYSHPGNYNVCLTISYTNSCTSNICNQVRVGVPNSTFSVRINSSSAGNTVTLSSVVIGGTPPFSYSWNLGDGNTSTLQNVVHTYSTANSYQACLQVTDANGNIANSCNDIATQGFQGCTTNFNFLPDTVGIPNPQALSNVTITWTDNSGVIYTSNSNNVPQPSDSYFQIISEENYLKNLSNQSTKKLHVKFKCLVFNGSNSRQISNGDAVIAVAYK